MKCSNCGATLAAREQQCPICGAFLQKRTKKSAVFVVLAAGLAIAMCSACLSLSIFLKHTAAPTEETLEVTLVTTTAESDAIADVTMLDITDASGTAFGKRGILHRDKEALQQMDAADFSAFCKTLNEADCAYVTVDFSDGTGLVFNGSEASMIYATLDTEGFPATVLGVVLQSPDGSYSYIPAETHADVGNVVTSTADTSATVPTTSADAEVTAEPAHAETVYVTASGTKFHRAGCSYLRKSKIEMSRKEAEGQGYTACSRCKP